MNCLRGKYNREAIGRLGELSPELAHMLLICDMMNELDRPTLLSIP